MRPNRRKRRILVGAAMCAILLGVTACSESGFKDSGDDLKLGLIAPIEGSFAALGKDLVDGAELAVEQINADGGVLGRKLTLEVRDEGAEPEDTALAVRQFADSGVHFLLGILNSAKCEAAAPVLEEVESTLAITTCANSSLSGAYSGEVPHDRIVTIGPREKMMTDALASVIAERIPELETVDIFGFDYQYGRDAGKWFLDELTKLGSDAKLGNEQFVPLGELQYGPQVAKMSRNAAKGDPSRRALLLTTYSVGTQAFLQQAMPLGLLDEYAAVLTPNEYYPTGRALGANAPEVWNAYIYHPGVFDDEVDKQFIEATKEKTGELPTGENYTAYMAVRAYAAAIEKAGTADTSEVLDALSRVSIPGPGGGMVIDPATHQGIAPMPVTLTKGSSKSEDGLELMYSKVIDPKTFLP